MLRLAVPVVLAEIGWVAMGVVDVMMVGRIDAESIGAVSVGRAAIMLVVVFGLGLLLGLDTVISQAFGAGDIRECKLGLLHGVYLTLLISGPLMLVGWAMGLGLRHWPMDPRVVELAVPYLLAVNGSILPILLYPSSYTTWQAVDILLRPPEPGDFEPVVESSPSNAA